MINAGDAKTIKELKGHTGRIHALAFSPKDGNLIVSASADKTAKLWDVNQGKSVRDFAGHGDAVLSVNVSRDGTKLVTGSADKTARIWNLADGKTLATLSGHAGPVSSCLHLRRRQPGRDRLGRSIGAVLGGGERPRAPENVGPPCGDRRGRDAAGQQVGRLGGRGQCRPGVGSGRRADLRRPRGADPQRGRSSRTEPRSSRPRPTSRSRSSTSTPAMLVRTLAGHTGAVKAVAVTKDGAKLISGSDDKTFRVWNVADGKPLLTTPALPAGVAAVAAASNNTVAAAGLADGTVKVFDLTAADPAKAERASYQEHRRCRDRGRLPARSGDAARRLRRQGRLALGASLAGGRQDAGRPYRPGLQRGLEPRRQARGHGRRRQDGPALGRRQGRPGPLRSMPTRRWLTPWRSIPRETCSPPAATTS